MVALYFPVPEIVACTLLLPCTYTEENALPKECTGASDIVTVGFVDELSGTVTVNVVDDADPTCVVAPLSE